MRRLYLTLGAPASGKSTFIEDNYLQDYSISSDNLRRQLGGYRLAVDPSNNWIEKVGYKNSNERKVWSTLWNIVERRMQNGLSTIVDTTLLYKGAFKNPNKLRKKYNYQVYILDFMKGMFNGNYSQEQLDKVIHELKTRNEKRKYPVPDSAIEDFTTRYVNFGRNVPDWVKVIDANNQKDVINALSLDITLNMEQFDRLQIIGDIHADYDALMKVFDSHRPGTAYIFVGDYLDRGTKTIETFNFITQELKGKNLFFCTGNHEDGWEKWQQLREKHGQFATLSLPKLLDHYGEEPLDEIIKDFTKKTVDYMIFDYFGKRYFVSHAGFEPQVVESLGTLDAIRQPREVFVYGLGNKGNYDYRNAPYDRNIDKVWDECKDIPKTYINVHGHRNSFNEFVRSNSYNLTADGKFRWITVTKEGITPHEIDRIDVPTFDEQLEMEPHIKRREVDDHIVANNFDKHVFFTNEWNHLNTKARGLFTRDNEIVGRGFNKFFVVGQDVNDNVDTSLDSLEYPVWIMKKHDGFLGVVFYDNDKNKIRVYSKGGSDTYSPLAEQVLKDTGYYKKIQNYYSDKMNRDSTLLFEIIDPEKDVHIVKYHHKHAYPLAIISNDENGIVLNHTDTFNPHWGSHAFQEMTIEIDENNFIAYAHNKTELTQSLKIIEHDFPTREGVVLYGKNKMLKIKFPFYLKAKELRGALENGGKRKWYYDAQNWYKKCKARGITEFTPNLALQLRKEDLEKKDKNEK